MISEADRQLVLLSLALCARLRPGFDQALSLIAEQLDGRAMFEDFKRFNENVQPQHLDPVDYQALLGRYIEHVGECEAMDYLGEGHAGITKWEPGELEILRRLAGRDPVTGKAT